jgi:hypothetical protein
MPSSPAELASAALVVPIYHITVKVLDRRKYLSNIHAIETPTAAPLARQSRPALTAVSDFMHHHFSRDNTPGEGYNFGPRMCSEYEIINSEEEETTAQDIRYLAQQSGVRVPDKKEALAMAKVSRIARGTVGES